MTRFRSTLGILGFLALLVGIVVAGSAGLGLAALLGIIALSASTATSGTVQNLLAGLQIRSEGYIHRGVSIEVAPPSGPVAGTVAHVGARLTIVESNTGTALVPNSQLTSNLVFLPKAKEESCTLDER